MIELKPCPFCGHKAKLRKYELNTVDNEFLLTWYVICGNLRCGIRTMECVSPDSAARIWNRRTDHD